VWSSNEEERNCPRMCISLVYSVLYNASIMAFPLNIKIRTTPAGLCECEIEGRSMIRGRLRKSEPNSEDGIGCLRNYKRVTWTRDVACTMENR
jgi:hypothetical protein